MAVNKVLVCDDSAPDLVRIEGIVRGAGKQVVSARTGAEALVVAESEQPDLIFLDIIMPEMDGYEACRKLSKNAATKHIPVIFVTSKGQKADRVWAKMQGGKDLVAKPYQDDEIQAQLGKY